MKIHLRKRVGKLSKENLDKGRRIMTSLYLDYNLKPGDKRHYEWLNLHIFEWPKTNLEKDHNKQTLLLAESIRAKRLVDQQSTSHGFISNVTGKIDFIEYFKKLTEKKLEESKGNHGNWQSTYHHLANYCNGHVYTLERIDENFLEGFKEYLSKNISRRGEGKISPNSALSYFNKVRAAIREAYQKKLIKDNPCSRVKGLKAAETRRQYLTLEELQAMAAIPCSNELLNKAFMFSALTGLRWSDVRAMTWDKIKHSEKDGWSLQFTQQKTKAMEVLPVSEQAVKVLGERKENSTEIFKGLIYTVWMNTQLQNWVTDAGINKKITFHCARHSFATLHLTMNTDIYTVSKLLGHRHIKTTEIYAKVIDKKKIAAANSIPELHMGGIN
jgi:integrase